MIIVDHILNLPSTRSHSVKEHFRLRIVDFGSLDRENYVQAIELCVLIVEVVVEDLKRSPSIDAANVEK